jgi:hypothetical protein
MKVRVTVYMSTDANPAPRLYLISPLSGGSRGTEARSCSDWRGFCCWPAGRLCGGSDDKRVGLSGCRIQRLGPGKGWLTRKRLIDPEKAG